SNNVLTRSGTPCMYHAAFTSGDPCPESACDGEPLWDVTHWMPLPSHPEAPRSEMWDVRDGQGDLYARQPLEKAASIVMQHPDQDLRLSPAPRPEASAPVGVEGLVKEMRMLAGVGIPVKPECVGRWADQLETLDQQPAAVDEAAAIRAFEEHFEASSDDPYFEGELELWLTAWRNALAAQQQGGPQE